MIVDTANGPREATAEEIAKHAAVVMPENDLTRLIKYAKSKGWI